MENKFQLRVNGPERIQPSDRLRNRKRRTMRQVNGYGVGKMADPAVLLVFELIVPVARGLKGERQNERSHQNSYDSECYSPTHISSRAPHPDVTETRQQRQSWLLFFRFLSQFTCLRLAGRRHL